MERPDHLQKKKRRERGSDRGKEDKISQQKVGNQLFNVTSVFFSNANTVVAVQHTTIMHYTQHDIIREST